MAFNDDEFKEWHEIVLKQRNAYKNLLRDIIIGVPTIPGMACTYRDFTLKEIKKAAEDLLNQYE
jgi:hypothetical protein